MRIKDNSVNGSNKSINIQKFLKREGSVASQNEGLFWLDYSIHLPPLNF